MGGSLILPYPEILIDLFRTLEAKGETDRFSNLRVSRYRQKTHGDPVTLLIGKIKTFIEQLYVLYDVYTKAL